MKHRHMLLVLVAVLFSASSISIATDAPLSIHFIDVGQADATLLVDNGETMLIDAGNNADGNLVVRYLEETGIKHLDVLVATHPHEDHIGGMDTVLEAFTPSLVLLSPKSHTTQSFDDFLEALSSRETKATIPQTGDVFRLGSSVLTLLAPVKAPYMDINNNSLVFMLERNNLRVLFAADAETVSEWHMLARETNLKADVLKVGHHGSDTSTNATFIRRVDPTISVIHVGKNNPYGHPSQSVLARIPGTILRTDRDGTIVLTIGDDGIAWSTHTQSPNPAWHEVLFIGDRNTLRYHLPDCRSLPTEADQIGLFDHLHAQELGYQPCPQCKPDTHLIP